MQKKEEDMLAQEKMADIEEELSQNEYKRGISGWNFNLDDMKAQASLIQDIDCGLSDCLSGSTTSLQALDSQDTQSEIQEDIGVSSDKSYSSPRQEDLSLNNSTHAINGNSMDSTSIPTNQPTEILAGNCVLADRNVAANKGESDKTQDQLQNGSTCNWATSYSGRR